MSPNFVWLWKCADGSCNQVDFGDYTDARAALYRTTTPEIAVRAKMDCGAVKVDRATTPSSTGTPRATEIVLWASAIGALSLAAVVNQVAITLCRRGQAAIEPDQYEH